MPGKNRIFSYASILFRPHQKRTPQFEIRRAGCAFVVEAPGYRPRVRKVITNDVYRHSRFPSVLNICLVSE